MYKFGCTNRDNKIGILIAQLGTPDAPTAKALRPYLKEFLWDKRIIEKPRWLWWLILNLIILVVRPKRSAKLYARIWTDEGSPLLVYTKKLVEVLRSKYQDRDIMVSFGMRYGSNNISDAIKDLKDSGCQRILVFNMYPHYSATTVGSNLDAVYEAVKKYRWVPSIKVVEPYYNHPEYIAAQVDIINEQYKKFEKRPEKLVLSYHGIPMDYARKGDPYCCMCNVTTRCLEQKLDFAEDEIVHTFQSRFGKDPWLQPYTDYTINDLAKQGIKDIAVVAPGFTTDCLETLDELGNEAEEEFLEHGGETLRLIPCLNDHPRWIQAMQNMIDAELATWVEHDSFENYSGFECSCGINNCNDINKPPCVECRCGKKGLSNP